MLENQNHKVSTAYSFSFIDCLVREIFANARLTAPSLIFFDEIDAIVGKRSSEFGRGGGDVVQERILSTLLNEMDGITSSQHNKRPVLVVGATNRKDLIDEALLRPGRFDRHIYVSKIRTRFILFRL